VEDGLAVAEEGDVRVPCKAEARGDVVGVVLRLDDGVDWGEWVVQIKRGVWKRVFRGSQIVIAKTGVDGQVGCQLDVILNEECALPGMRIDAGWANDVFMIVL